MGKEELAAGGGEGFDFHAVPQRVAIEQDAEDDHLVGFVEVGGLQHGEPGLEGGEDLSLGFGEIVLLGDEAEP